MNIEEEILSDKSVSNENEEDKDDLYGDSEKEEDQGNGEAIDYEDNIGEDDVMDMDKDNEEEFSTGRNKVFSKAKTEWFEKLCRVYGKWLTRQSDRLKSRTNFFVLYFPGQKECP